MSKEEQKEHFLGRLEDPTKYWKFDPSDLEARARWNDYMAAWQDVFARTSTEQAPGTWCLPTIVGIQGRLCLNCSVTY